MALSGPGDVAERPCSAAQSRAPLDCATPFWGRLLRTQNKSLEVDLRASQIEPTAYLSCHASLDASRGFNGLQRVSMGVNVEIPSNSR